MVSTVLIVYDDRLFGLKYQVPLYRFSPNSHLAGVEILSVIDCFTMKITMIIASHCEEPVLGRPACTNGVPSGPAGEIWED
jgi:hypothetical protein